MKCISKGNDHDLAEAAQIDPELIPGQATETKLLKTSKVAKWMTGILTAALLILWPFPMFGSGYIFSKEFFTGWVVIGVIWVFAVFICVGIYPVWREETASDTW
jgi:membrane protein YdbS with pleckstrin-like domain